MRLIVEGSKIMMREEAPGKLFKFNKQPKFFLSDSLMIKYRSFSLKLQNDPSPAS